ncbi:MAG: hypothetical protein KME16_08685 [Scytolyngbya sp. HA4215-MV1]|jgi:hypothetical protein|nr:hypothetical protein [Scytolyngbya sp. HA4215-MV1]
MNEAIAALGTVLILTAFASSVNAQSTAEPGLAGSSNSAASLGGLQERKISRTDVQLPQAEAMSATSSQNTGSTQRPFNLPKQIEVRVQPERERSQTQVFPDEDNAKGSQVRVLYQLDE